LYWEIAMLDGFYVGYFSAISGYGVVLFIFKDQHIVGADAGGVKFDGNYLEDRNTGNLSGIISIDAPPNVDLVQGVNTGPLGLKYEVPFTLPRDFLEEPYISMSTPFGQVNVKLEKLRDLGAAE
jgi:hypothetical protein